MIKVATVCTGIGSPEQAIKELGMEHEITFACEIDKYARQSYLANFNPKYMYTDMTKENWDFPEQYSDFFFGGIPCQAFSLAGKRLGELDPRGLLFFDYYRYVKNQQPKVFGIENVKGLLSDNGGKTFQNWLLLLDDTVNGHRQMFSHPDCLGYNIYWQVLNTKDYGLPQNRERVFIIGIRKDIDDGSFRFPKGWKLDKRLKDVLESDVDEKYYLSDNCVNRLTGNKEGYHSEIRTEESIASTILAIDYKLTRGMNVLQVKEATKQGYAIAEPGDSINLSNPNSETRRGRVGKEIANTLDTACNQAVVEPICVAMRGRNPENHSDRTTGAPTQQRLEPNSQGTTNTITSVQKDNLIIEHKSRIRRLTPLECWRLQGFPDEAFYNAKNDGLSDTQLYKQAGNSISVPVIKAIIKNICHLIS